MKKTIIQPSFYQFLFRQHIDKLNVFSLPIKTGFADQSIYIQDQTYPNVVHPCTFTDFDIKMQLLMAEQGNTKKTELLILSMRFGLRTIMQTILMYC